MRKLFIALVVLYLIAGIAYAGPEGKHVVLNGVDIVVYYPDLSLTPGVADPSVKQRKIQTSICVSGYTKDNKEAPN